MEVISPRQTLNILTHFTVKRFGISNISTLLDSMLCPIVVKKTLNNLSAFIIQDIFHKNNTLLSSNIYENWISNVNWKHLSISYRVDRYVALVPEINTQELTKFWVDI